MTRNRFWIIALILLCPTAGHAQDWHGTEKVNVMTDAKLTEYTLTGKFIKPPSRGAIDPPRLVVECAHGVGSKPDHRLNSYLIVGAVLDSASVQYRLDDRKPQPGLHWESCQRIFPACSSIFRS